jgi:hypothetical protein
VGQAAREDAEPGARAPTLWSPPESRPTHRWDRRAPRMAARERNDDGHSRRIGGAPVAGFYTYGEIAWTQGMSGFHNQTLVVLSIS